jgi:hypothetical protein
MIFILVLYRCCLMRVLGGSVYAVMTAVRLANEGHTVRLIHDRKRVGVFPQALLPEEFFRATGVKPEPHSEAVYDEAIVNEDVVKLPTRVYMVRTTPVLEKALAVNGITFSSERLTKADDAVDCRPQRWEHFKLIQILSVNEQCDTNKLMISFQKNRYVKVTANAESTSLTYFYTHTGFGPTRNTIAWAEIFFYYRTPKPRPVVCWLGQDVAEAAAGDALDSALNTAAPVDVESYLTRLQSD